MFLYFSRKIIAVYLFIIILSSLKVYAQQKTLDNIPRYKDYNVILIFIDTLRADHLGCYGYNRNTSPNIDSLAKESVIFKNMFTSNTVTITSFMSIITSLYPKSHGVFSVFKDKLSENIRTLAQILKIHGYETIWFGPLNDPHLDPNIGFGKGFSVLNESHMGSGYLRKSLLYAKSKLLEWLEKNKDKKFFLNIHTYEIHDPYFPSKEYRKYLKMEISKKIPLSPIEHLPRVFVKLRSAAIGKDTSVSTLLGNKLIEKFIAIFEQLN